MRVVVGFVSTDVLLWRFAGASGCATGKFFNLRRFTPSRFEPPSSGGGQLPYWLEDSLLAFIREGDLVRIRDRGLCAVVPPDNAAAQKILKKIGRGKGEKWVADSWRQYLAWFGHRAVMHGKLDSQIPKHIEHARQNWNVLLGNNILMEEQANTGYWLPSWADAIERFSG